MKTLSEFRAAVMRYVQDADGNLQEEDYNAAIEEAAFVLSKRDPRNVFETKTGDGSAYEWAFATTTYIPYLSQVTHVYWPYEADSSDDPLPPLDRSQYFVYEKTAGVWWFKLRDMVPTSGEVVRFHYTSKHVVSDTVANCTIVNPQWENDAIKLAAALCLQMLSVKAIAVGNPAINADVVNYQSRSGEYARRARELTDMSGLKAYIETSSAQGAGVFVSMGKTKDITEELI